MKRHDERHPDFPRLHAADIVLIRHKRSLFRYFLRKAMRSRWDHVALILFPRDEAAGVEHAIIVESIRSDSFRVNGGSAVSLHRLDKYLDKPKRYAVGIKHVPDINEDVRQRILLYMLMNVDAPYWPWNELRITLSSFSRTLSRFVLKRQRFSCSGLIQKAFYDAVSYDARSSVVFKEDVYSPIELQELTTPEDFASSKKCDWIYGHTSL